MSTLEDAILMATEAHRDQKDKAGAPYILHPLAIMMRMESETEMIVALLHDVIEDTGVMESDLEEFGFSEEVIEAVNCLTRREGEPYREYIDRIKQNPLAVKVKLADLENNMDIKRIKDPSEKDFSRIKKYLHYWKLLGGK